MTGIYRYTVCGLRVVRELPPVDWACYSTVAEACDAAGAYGFAQADVKGDWTSGPNPVECVDLAVACVHVGAVPIVGELRHADDPLTPAQYSAEQKLAVGLPSKTFTVCGIDRHTFRTLRMTVDAQTWLLAWQKACRVAEHHGARLLTAAIHEGAQPGISGFDRADPLAGDDDIMEIVVTEKWGQAWTAR